ncbi:MAG: ChuX/HutX family heme-like substrate-binding protein [Thiomicrospira sp.]|jgi:putative hemin transport protein
MPNQQRAQHTHPTNRYILSPDASFIRGLADCGFWKASLINSALEHQLVGRFQRLAQRKQRLISITPSIEATLFLNKWHHIAIDDSQAKPTLTLYDRRGEPLYRLKSLEERDSAAHQALRQHLQRHADGHEPPSLRQRLPMRTHPRAIETHALQHAWQNLQQPQDANQIFKAHAHNLNAVYHALSPRFSRPIALTHLPTIFEQCRRQALTLHLSARNPALVQSYTGRIRKLLQLEQSLLIADAGFKLQLKLDRIQQAWWLRTPSAQGTRYDLKLMDTFGQEVLSITNPIAQQACNAWIKLSES